MNDYEKLKQKCRDMGTALTMSFKPNGDVLIYVSPDVDEEMMMKSLIMASAKIAEERGKHTDDRA